MEIKIRPIGIVREIINESGLEITYAYDDLLFIENSILIIKFDDDDPSKIGIYFSVDCDEMTGKDLFAKIKKSSLLRKMTAESLGKFRMEEDAGNEIINIEFIEENYV